jgi:hypothetical protein
MKPRILAVRDENAEQLWLYRSRGCLYLFSSAKRRMVRGCLRMPRPRKSETEELLQAKQDLRLAA